MLDGTDVTYSYDGTFDGFLCCVFEVYNKKEFPRAIYSPLDNQTELFPPKEIETDMPKAERVRRSIPKIHKNALNFCYKVFLTNLEEKELYLLKFLQMGYRLGSKVMYMLADETVNKLNTAVKFLGHEAHLYKGFIRFSVFGNALAAEIEPKNIVLPLLVRHFCERFPEENFMIYDKTHAMALIYEPHKYKIIPVERLTMPQADEEELKFRRLWKMFYKTIEVEGRHNPHCRMNLMPKRYWDCMTEFN